MPDLINQYLQEIGRYRILDKQEVKDLLAEGNKEDVVKANLKLVVPIARRYSRNGDLLDLIQEGNKGLMRAVDDFDPERDFKVSTYARWWIWCSIIRYSMDNNPEFIPRGILDKRKKYSTAGHEYMEKHGEWPDDKYVAENSEDIFGKKYNVSQVRELKEMFSRTSTSMQDAVGDSTTIEDTIGYEEDIHQGLSDARIREVVDSYLQGMKIEDKVIFKGFYLKGINPSKMDRYFGSSPGRSRNKLEKMKRNIRNKYMDDPRIQDLLSS